MPCNSIAVVSARVRPDVASSLLASRRALDALALGIEAVVSERPVSVTSASERYAQISIGRAATVEITPSGISVRSAYWTRQQVAEVSTKIEQIANELAVALAFEQTARKLKARHPLAEVKVDSRKNIGTIRIKI